MDSLLKSIQVIRLKTSDGRYLTADEDQELVRFVKPNRNVGVSRNTEWRVIWLGAEKFFLMSTHGKTLTYPRGWAWGMIQEVWPLLDYAYGTDWYLQIMNNNNYYYNYNNVREFQARLIPAKESGHSKILESVRFPTLYPSVGWTVEVVKTNIDEKQHVGMLLQVATVGQMVVNYVSDGGRGGGFSHFNSGHNVNGSGSQTNGDVFDNSYKNCPGS